MNIGWATWEKEDQRECFCTWQVCTVHFYILYKFTTLAQPICLTVREKWSLPVLSVSHRFFAKYSAPVLWLAKLGLIFLYMYLSAWLVCICATRLEFLCSKSQRQQRWHYVASVYIYQAYRHVFSVRHPVFSFSHLQGYSEKKYWKKTEL